MKEILNWEWWQIGLTAVFGTVWIVFIILDFRRKSKLKKLIDLKVQELKSQGYSDELIKELMQRRDFLSLNSNYQGSQETR